MGEWTLEDIAEAVHRGRFPSDREATLFEHEDRAGRDYCLRIARSVAAMLSTSPVPEKEGAEDGLRPYIKALIDLVDFGPDASACLHEAEDDLPPKFAAAFNALTDAYNETARPRRFTKEADANATPTDTGATVDGVASERVLDPDVRDFLDRKAAEKLLRDVCACAAEADSLDLPHVQKECVEPIAKLVAERRLALELLRGPSPHLSPPSPTVGVSREEISALGRIQDALTQHDEAVKACPFGKPSPPPNEKPCPKCRATARDGCFLESREDDKFVKIVREALTKADAILCRIGGRPLETDLVCGDGASVAPSCPQASPCSQEGA